MCVCRYSKVISHYNETHQLTVMKQGTNSLLSSLTCVCVCLCRYSRPRTWRTYSTGSLKCRNFALVHSNSSYKISSMFFYHSFVSNLLWHQTYKILMLLCMNSILDCKTSMMVASCFAVFTGSNHSLSPNTVKLL